MSGLIGKKIGMTNIFAEDGKILPCTVVQAGPCTVTQVRTKNHDGYDALQLGFNEKSEKSTNKSELGHYKKSGAMPMKKLVEFKGFENDYKLGDKITVEHFNVGEYVDVTGTSKGKGFQGVVKRHGFAGVGQATHGQHNRLRAPGSIGAASYPARVFKGMKMAGRMGNKRVTKQNLRIIEIDNVNNLLIVKGSIPGKKNSIVYLKDSVKRS